MEYLRKLVNSFLKQNGKEHLVVLSFEKKDVSFGQFTLANFDVLINYLNNNLIDCYESGDITSAARLRINIAEIKMEKLALEERIKRDNQ